MARLFLFDPSIAQQLSALVTIRLGAIIIRFTTAGFPVIVESESGSFVYEPWPGSDITGFQAPSDGTPANADIVLMAMPGSAIPPGFAVRGMLDDWPVTIELFDTGQLELGTFAMISGTTGSPIEDTRGMVTIAANGQLRLASERSLVEKYSLTGRESLGDDRCKIPLCVEQDIASFDIRRGQSFVRPDFNAGTTGLIRVRDAYGRFRTGVAGTVEDYANVFYECTTQGITHATVAPTYDPVVGNSTTDGTAVFIARDAWTRYARGVALDPFSIQFTTLPDPRATFIDPSTSRTTWYEFGGLFVRSGKLKGYSKMDVVAWDPVTYIATLGLPILMDDIPANTEFEIHTGCDLTASQCYLRFNDIKNRRAEDLVPPPELIAGF